MKNFFGLIVVFLGTLLLIGAVRFFSVGEEGLVTPFWSASSSSPKPVAPPPISDLEDYAFDRLRDKKYFAGSVSFGRVLEEDEVSLARVFYYEAEGKKISGRMDLPRKEGYFPVVLMLRGYADKEGYFIGSGTHRVAKYFAENGFITLAPDFLGFGESAEEEEDVLLNRFRRPETILYLLASMEEIDHQLEKIASPARFDPDRLFLWGHSNGGQIGLSVLEISRRPIPASFWAPVSKPFPESVLQYADEMSDEGKLVIDRITAFETGHDCARYSIASYWSWITAPIQIQQGTGDIYVAADDSQKLCDNLKEAGVRVDYLVYPGADHNLKQVWETAVARDVTFFRNH